MNMHTPLRALLFVCTAFGAALPVAAQQTPQEQVFATERAFAATMAARDLEAFSTFLSEEAIFFSGDLRGKQAVVDGWAPMFEGATAPFSWEPDRVEVLPSGTLALSTGIVRNPDGVAVSRFNSVWRLEDGAWRIVFDKGGPLEPEEQP
jgi:ketosteroid isomerase-like protein